MKRLRYAAIGFLVGLACLSGEVAQAVDATLLLGYNGGNNSNPHNLSKLSGNTIEASTETQICIFCHTPHGAATQSTLWSRKDPTNLASFGLYNSATLRIEDAGIKDVTQYVDDDIAYPNGSTKMCLSCHDGATAIGDLIDGTVIAMTTANLSASTKKVDAAELSATHPVSFVYTADVVTYINGIEGAGSHKLPTDPDVRLDSQKRMQCTTCHNPHLDTNNGGTYQLPFWANYTNSGTEDTDYDNTCKECHQNNPMPPPFTPDGTHGLP